LPGQQKKKMKILVEVANEHNGKSYCRIFVYKEKQILAARMLSNWRVGETEGLEALEERDMVETNEHTWNSRIQQQLWTSTMRQQATDPALNHKHNTQRPTNMEGARQTRNKDAALAQSV
jgi:hypothetical protein